MITLDGSYGEGGGAIIRNALALSALTGKPFSVIGIRKSRPNPGLRAQHLSCVKAAQQLCNAKVKHASLHSTQLEFIPGKITPQTISIDIGTAGSITLLLQALLLPAIFSPGKIRFRITGGTDTNWSMPFDYFTNVFLPHIQHLADINVKLLRRGYYPKGGGKVDITIKPKYQLPLSNPLDINKQGTLLRIEGISHAAEELKKAQVAERQAKAARHELANLNLPVKIQKEYSPTSSIGSGICLWAVFESAIVGADALGERGKRAEIVGKHAAQNLKTQLSAPVDKYLADQLITYLALLGGSMTCTEITKHSLTNIYVVEQFLDKKITVKGNTLTS